MVSKSVNLNWVVVPAILTLAITVLRMVGELNDWNPTWFGKAAGGGGAILGISWLMPIMGIYFAWRLVRDGNGPAHRGKALLLAVLGSLFFFGTMAVLVATREEVEVAGKMEPVRSMGFFYGFAGVGVAACVGTFIAMKGWPALGKLMLVYGIAARVPVVVITYILVPLDKGTHFEKLAPFAPTDLHWLANASFLSFAQLCAWIPMTVFFGAIFGALASLVLPRALDR